LWPAPQIKITTVHNFASSPKLQSMRVEGGAE
jgi:hypothetical protein